MKGAEATMREHRRASLQATAGGKLPGAGGESKAGGRGGPMGGLAEDDEEDEEDDEDEDEEDDDEEYDGEIKLDEEEAKRVTEEAGAAQDALRELADSVDAWTMVQDPTSRMFYYYVSAVYTVHCGYTVGCSVYRVYGVRSVHGVHARIHPLHSSIHSSFPSLHSFTYSCVCILFLLCILFLHSLTVEPCDGGGVGGDARMLGAGNIRRGGEGGGGGGDHRGVTKEVAVAGGATREGCYTCRNQKRWAGM